MKQQKTAHTWGIYYTMKKPVHLMDLKERCHFIGIMSGNEARKIARRTQKENPMMSVRFAHVGTVGI